MPNGWAKISSCDSCCGNILQKGSSIHITMCMCVRYEYMDWVYSNIISNIYVRCVVNNYMFGCQIIKSLIIIYIQKW